MNTAVAFLVVCLAAAAMALPRGYGNEGYGYDNYDGYGNGYGYGYGGLRPVHNGVAAPYRNSDRQVAVNHQAAYLGTGTGTAKYYGVPGTGNNFGYRYGYGGDRY